MTQIELPSYEPRPWQAKFNSEFFTAEKKRAILVWARRHGKDVCCWNYLILEAIRRRGSYYYLYPVQLQARKAIWEGMTSGGRRFLDFIPKELMDGEPNNTEMRIKLTNGSIIRVMGSDNHDALRSSNPLGVVFSEYAWHSQDTWPLVVEPILLENGGWAIFNSTPYGKNHFYELYSRAKNRPSWYTSFVSNSESKLFTAEQLNELRENSGISEEVILQEYYCSFDRGIDGSYYGRIINDLRLKGRMRENVADNYLKVHTAWDLGVSDDTSIFFYQVFQGEIRIIDCYSNSGEPFEHYLHIVETKRHENKWIYGSHFVPHDARAREFQSGASLVSYAAELGITVTVLPRETSSYLGIERVRKCLPKCYFDAAKCEKGIKALESYRKKRDDKNQCYYDTPLHDWSSHYADAFRYLCQAYETMQSSVTMELDEYRNMKDKYRNGERGQFGSILG